MTLRQALVTPRPRPGYTARHWAFLGKGRAAFRRFSGAKALLRPGRRYFPFSRATWTI